ncbi:MAG: dihydropyrimidine dehydrogenase, partial [Candidatus Omnitrophica bacterium]|nr:dihydropyrimidine dehydrogenase [Candidatus Omnitrophota bacterium]
MKKEPVLAKETSPLERASNFGEVVQGYDEKDVLLEASRCIQCKNPTCISGC